MSFLIPTWKRQEIKGLTQMQEEMLYASTPYNLNDFKQQHQSQNYIFSSP